MGDKKAVMSPVVHAIAGGIGGVIALTCTYPLDIIKTRLQVQSKHSKETTNYQGTLDAWQQIVAREGILGLYKGLQAGLLQTLINQFVYFYFYEFLKPHYQGPSQKNLSTLLQLILGIHAAAMNCVVTLPLAVVSTRIQTNHRAHDGLIATFLKVFEEDGVAGLWRGLQPSLILTVNPAITHLVYEKLKALVEKRNRAANVKGGPGALETFVIAAIAKTVATVVTYPYIMAKVRLQWKSGEKAEALQYRGTVDVLRKVMAAEGVQGWYKGMGPQIVKGVLTQAILFMMKEEIMLMAVKLVALFSAARNRKAVPSRG